MTQRNLCSNPSLETNTTGWTTSNMPMTRTAGSWGSGAWYGDCSISGSAAAASVSFGSTTYVIPAVAGDRVFVSVKIKAINAGAEGTPIAPRLEYRNSIGAVLSTYNAPAIFAPPSAGSPITAYILPSLAPVAPANTVNIRVSFQIAAADAVAGDRFGFDALDIRINEPPDEYFDGTFPDAAFEGTAHASSSVRIPHIDLSTRQSWRTGGVTVEGFLYRCDAFGNRLDDLSDRIVSGSVNWNADRGAGVKLSGAFVLDQRGLVRPYLDFVTPVLRLTWFDGTVEEQQYGVHLVDWPEDAIWQKYGWQSFRGMDPTWFPYNYAIRDTINYASGDNVVTKMADLVTASGWSNVAFPVSTRTFGKAVSIFPPKRAYDAIVSQFDAMGWYAPYANLDGSIATAPYRDLATAQPDIVVTMEDPVDEWKVVPTTTTLANVITVYKENTNEGAAPIASVAENFDPGSPISTVYRPDILREITNADIKTQAEADALALQYLAEANSFQRVISGKLSPGIWMKPYAVMDNYMADTAWGSIAGRYHVREWTVNFTQDNAEISLEANMQVEFTEGSF